MRLAAALAVAFPYAWFVVLCNAEALDFPTMAVAALWLFGNLGLGWLFGELVQSILGTEVNKGRWLPVALLGFIIFLYTPNFVRTGAQLVDFHMMTCVPVALAAFLVLRRKVGEPPPVF